MGLSVGLMGRVQAAIEAAHNRPRILLVRGLERLSEGSQVIWRGPVSIRAGRALGCSVYAAPTGAPIVTVSSGAQSEVLAGWAGGGGVARSAGLALPAGDNWVSIMGTLAEGESLNIDSITLYEVPL